MKRPIKFFAGSNTKYLANKIANAFGVELNKSSIIEFSDGEFEPSFDETVRGADVFLIQSTTPPSDNLMELLLMIDAAKRASAANIIAVMPYFGYARQDKKGKPRVPIGAKLVANLLSAAGVDRIMTIDLHADQIQGFFEVPVDHLYASELFIEDITNLNLPNLIIASPDMGGSKRANAYAKILNSGVVICYKERKQANVIGEMKILGDVKGKDVIIIDDMVDTGGTLTKAADLMMESGATSVRAYCTHAILSGTAYERLDASNIKELVVTNTIPKTHNSSKVREISVADFFAQTITSVVKNESISDKWKSNQ
jgi:ribose-phosphate pyrophosphokinase